MMQQVSAGDLTTGIVVLCVSMVAFLAVLNALITRYFRWRVSREPKLLDTLTQREFDWSWNLTALVTVSHVYGFLWALNALNISFEVFSGDFLKGTWIPAVVMIVAYITLFISTGRTKPSKNAMLVFTVILALAFAIGFLIAGMLLASVDPEVLASVFGTSNPLRPGDIVSIYAVMGFFVAPDYLLIIFLLNMIPLAIGYLVCQLIDALIKLGKRLCPAPPAQRSPSI
ncbi:MAG: hypothetical protein Q6373_018315 [Candidatus Sigynarchaeota archaeon]